MRLKLSVVGAENAEELDAEDFFDFCVPATVLCGFMELKITSRSWCDMRFYRMLERLCILEPIFPEGVPWLLAHRNWRLHENESV